ncbi:MAG: hypothetical protein J5I94_11080 [Phaeodactylibacter sp.]|nr:hypothetical protein [Phaeodactylibacter sp.]
MNADNFAQYLEDPSLLYQASYQELKSLALQYPYCQNLHLLLFQKSYMEGSREWEKDLEKAAAYSIDRKHLYYQAKALDKRTAETDNFLLSEEFLELKSLDGLQLEERLLPGAGEPEPEAAGLQLEFGPIPQRPSGEAPSGLDDILAEGHEEEEDAEKTAEISAGLAPKEDEGPHQEENPGEEPESGLAEPASDEELTQLTEASEPPPPSFEADEELVGACSSLLHVLELKTPELFSQPDPVSPEKGKGREKSTSKKGNRPPLPSPQLEALKQKYRHRPVFTVDTPAEEPAESPKPQPKQSFTSWVEQFQAPNVQVRLSELMESKKREESRRRRKKKKKQEKSAPPPVGRLALRSITENKEILSETLAELLASQGEYQRAIEMYRALMLVFPQKSDFFAEKIENLKSK